MDIKTQIRRQLELEDEARALGSRRYHSRDLPWKPEAGTADEEANLPPGRKLMKVALAPTAAGIEEFLREATSGKAGRLHAAVHSLLLTDAYEAAYLTCRVLTNASAHRLALQKVALQISEALLDHVSMEAYREINKVGYKGFLRKQDARGFSRQRRAAVRKLLDNEGALQSVSTAEKIAVGVKLIEIAIENTGLWVQDRAMRSRGWVYEVAPSEALQTWLDRQHARCSLLEPINMPMLVRPRRWRSPSHGGYLTRRPGNRLVKQRNAAYHEEIKHIDLANVYRSVNHIQDTPWRINNRILELMTEVWDAGGCLGGLPQRHDDLLPEKPEDIDYNEEARKEWKREAATTYKRNAQSVSGRVSVHQGLWVARRFSSEDRIYYPHELDFRGRVYPLPAFGPSPQGADWQKALLEFADGKPVGQEGKLWLYIHIANCFGVDKVSFRDRVDWTLSKAPELIDSALNPLDGQRFWTTADSPWCALAACMEFVGVLDESISYVSRIPIALDGSCSGLQHFSAMLRDEEGGKAVNLLPADIPQDIYTKVAKVAQDASDNSDDEFGKCWADGKVTRSFAKRPTMTYCYSATRYGMQRMILEELRSTDRDLEAVGKPPYLGGADNYQAALWLSHVIFSAVGKVVKAAEAAMDWLKSAAEIASSDGLPLWWTTPMGLPVLQEYRTQRGQRVSVHWAGQRVRLTFNDDTPKLDRRAQENGVAPNFVHSLDAAHLQAVALRCSEEGLNHLAVIHDSFGTHAADTERLGQILRETFIEQYTDNVLQKFYDELVAQLGEEVGAKLPKPPEVGDLDITQILSASYAFA